MTYLERMIEAHNSQNATYKIAFLIFTIAIIIIAIAILYVLTKCVVDGTKNKKAGKIAICITISLVIFWPVAIGQGIYAALKWNEQNNKNPNQDIQSTKPYSHTEFKR